MTKSNRDAEELLREFFTEGNNEATTLNLSDCNLKNLPLDFGKLIETQLNATRRLTLLNLANNKLSMLPDYLAKLPNLRILFLLNNNFTQVPKVIERMHSLRMLSFKQNALSGVLQASKLPPKLTWPILTSNRLTALSADFPQVCQHVKKLLLSNNELTTLPDLHESMHDLQLLRISNNRLSDFPTELCKLPKLC